jgi:hypothetical protein
MAAKKATTIEEIAAEVGRLFGTTEVHARKWLEQRGALLEALHLVREKATDLIGELSGENKRRLKQRAKLQALRTQLPSGHPAELMMSRKQRRMSPATRVKMRSARRKPTSKKSK